MSLLHSHHRLHHSQHRLHLGFVLLGSAAFCLVNAAAIGQAPAKKKSDSASTTPAAKAKAPESMPQVAEINKQIEDQWTKNKIVPSKQASDYEFIRRVSLDIIGRIATIDELERFMKDRDKVPAATRRAQLIDRLLAMDAYAENWASIWSVWLLTRSRPSDRSERAHQIFREQMQVWLYNEFAEGKPWDKIVAGLLTATGRNDDNGAVNYILAHLGEPTPPADASKEGRFSFVPITSRTTRLFLGLQTQCVQCHDQPGGGPWRQKHFWGVNAFFRQVERKSVGGMVRAGMQMDLPKLELADNPSLNNQQAVTFENRRAEFFATKPVFVDGKEFNKSTASSRREQLAQFVVEHECFAKAIVNRLWGHFFGRGLTVNGKDVDDFGEHNAETHPLTEDSANAIKAKHPERFKDKEPTLLDYLAEEFRSSPTNYDVRSLIRWICNSRAYNLTSVANGTIEIVEDQEIEKNGKKEKVEKKLQAANDRAEAEPFFSRMLLKSMSPEQLFESLWISTYANPHSAAKKTDAEKRRLRGEWMRRLTINFGDDEGNEATFNGTVVQALMLMNGAEINAAIEDKGGPVAAALRRASAAGVVDELYLATLNRRSTPEERKRIFAGLGLVQTQAQPPQIFWVHAGQDLLWAILNSSEFILNH